MNPTRDTSYSIIDAVLHPTDFSDASMVAFHHALKVALIAQAKLTLLHVAADEREAMDFPAVRETLESWGLLSPGSPRAAVGELGINVCKVAMRPHEPVGSVLHYLESHPTGLIVLAAHQHNGRMAWLQNSVSQPIARRSGEATLFIPEGNAGFVSAADGSVSLRNILVPIAHSPKAQPGVEAAARLAARLQIPAGVFTLLHVGEAADMPKVETPEVPGWVWKRVAQSGEVIHGIVEAARQTAADLVVMSTDGRNGFLDAFRGSHTERVLQQVPAPLLAVPEGSMVEAHLQMAAH